MLQMQISHDPENEISLRMALFEWCIRYDIEVQVFKMMRGGDA
jgi:hypothetical protein